MQHSGSEEFSEPGPPSKRRTPPSEQTDEAPGLVEREDVDIEREAPLGENEPVERAPPDRPGSEPPAFEE